MAKNNKKLVLLDTHAILHRAYHALPDFVSSKGEPTGALYGVVLMLLKIIEELNPDYIVACFDLPETTFRKEVYEDYKAGRRKPDEELIHQINRSRDILASFNIPIYEKGGFEADDILGTIVEQTKNKKDLDVVIASGDMDTMQLVDKDKVTVYTLKKGIKDTIIYNEDAMVKRFGFDPKLLVDYKGLRGDPSDNIIGIVGIGEKTATTLIQNFGTIESIYKKLKKDKTAFSKVGITPRIIGLLEEGEDEALFSKELATIRRDVPIDFELERDGWREGIDFEEVNKLLQDLEFRSLIQRVKKVFGMEESEVVEEEKKESKKLVIKVGEEEIQKTAIALWLVNSSITNPTLEDILNFAGTEDFEEAKNKIWVEIKKRDLEKVLTEIELPIIPVIKKIGKRGIKVDKKYLKDLSKKYHKELEKFRKNICKLAGEEFNINSPKQVGEVLFEKMGIELKNHKKTSTGAKSTNISVLEQLRPDHQIVDDILHYREFQKLLSTYIDNIPDMLDENNRLHTSFLQAGTVTGRMASQDPNLQNIPTKTELGRAIRNAFITEKGMKLVAIDYSQIELRIVALLSDDEKLIKIFKNGEDIHAGVASAVFNVPMDKVEKEMRRIAKIISFGMLYGMGVNSLRKNLGGEVTRAEAQKFYNDYFERFPKLASYIEDVKIETKERGYTKTFFGRRRYFEGIDSKVPFIRAMAERMAVNAPIQGMNADMIKLAMSRVNKFIEEEGLESDVFILLIVHDELIFEIKEELIKDVVPKIQKIMESVIPEKESKGIPFIVDASVGDNWGNLKKL